MAMFNGLMYSAVSAGGGSGDVTGAASSTDNAIARYDSTTGKVIQDSSVTLSDVSGSTVTMATLAGNALAFVATAPTATTGASQAGKAVTVTASAAVASTDTAGAAAGGSVTITAGAAARNASGNANGGDINLVTGAGIGTGTAGQVLMQAGTLAKPSIGWHGGISGIYYDSGLHICHNGAERLTLVGAGVQLNSLLQGLGNQISGYRHTTTASTAGSGSPLVLTSDESFNVRTNEGATAENYYTLPTAVAGMQFTFIVQDTDGIRITAATGDTIRPIAGTAASATGGFIRCATAGAFITLVSINDTEWVAIGSAGVWTIDV